MVDLYSEARAECLQREVSSHPRAPELARLRDLYHREHRNYTSLERFCPAFAFDYGKVKKWLDKAPLLAAELRELEALAKMSLSSVAERAEAMFPGLEPGPARFLLLWREGGDRFEAAQRIGRTFDEIEKWLAESPEFARKYVGVENEFILRVHDGFQRKAIEGTSTAAQMGYLAAYHPKFRRRLDVNKTLTLRGSVTHSLSDGTGAKKTWAEIYGRSSRPKQISDGSQDLEQVIDLEPLGDSPEASDPGLN